MYYFLPNELNSHERDRSFFNIRNLVKFY